MSKFITAVLTTASLALMNVSAAQATNKLSDVMAPNPTFPSQNEQRLEVSQSSQEMKLAYGYYCCLYWMGVFYDN